MIGRWHPDHDPAILYRMSMAMQDTVSLLQSLVRVPSVNPDLSGDPNIGGEKRIAGLLSELLCEKGFSVECHEPIPGRPNVIGRFGSAGAVRTILVEAHLDTQGVEGMTVPPFEALVRDGRLYGRGACDTKGPLASALMALTTERLHRLADSGIQIIFVGAIGEEKGNLGAEQLVARGIGADEALILEPTECAIVRAHKGTLWYCLEVAGRAAHGSTPGQGISAIRGMFSAIQAIDAELAEAIQRRKGSELGPPTVNIGTIRGGSSINIVPDQCRIEVDRRTIPGERNSEILDQIRERMDSLRATGAIASWNITLIKDGAPFETAIDSRLIRRLAVAVEEVNGRASRIEGAAWFSDAGVFSRTCREVAVFGPGSIRQAHTADEYIEIGELERGVRILGAFFDRLAAEQKEGAT